MLYSIIVSLLFGLLAIFPPYLGFLYSGKIIKEFEKQLQDYDLVIVDTAGRDGLNKDLIKEIASYSNLPIMACGGTNHIEDAVYAINMGASAVGIGSLFSFYGAHKAVLINYGTGASE